MSMPLSGFARGIPVLRTEKSHRALAPLLTAAIHAISALLIWLAFLPPPPMSSKPEAVIVALSDVPKKAIVDSKPPLPGDLMRPRAEQPAPPVFTIAAGAPPQAPVPLPASAAETSPLVGGTSGGDTMGQAGSGNGSDGNGAGSGGCLDPVWMGAVTERVRQFFYYPGAALASRITGVAMVRFGVRRNGQIDRLEVGRSSGNEELDKAAIDIMRKAQPLPPIPDRMGRDRVDGELPINFGVRNFAGRPSMGSCRS